MRLICPNCSAQYEIDVTLIPVEGRDVQCSNCGHTWFELPPPAEAEATPSAPNDAPEPESYDDPAPEPDEDAAADTQSYASKAIAAATDDVVGAKADKPAETEPFKDVDDPFEAAASEFAPTAQTDNTSADDSDSHTTTPEPESSDTEQRDQNDGSEDLDLTGIAPTTLKARRPSDAADVDLLREEAERELTQRRARPSEALESQTDLGLEDITNRKTPSRALRARMARSSGNTPTFEDTKTVSDSDYQAPQRDLLPDIDEINSTLNQSDTGEQAHIGRGNSGFRLGFGIVVLLCVMAILAYVFAPNLANAVPGAETVLIRFVDLANQLRDWINGLLA